jgi:hypothetical protein
MMDSLYFDSKSTSVANGDKYLNLHMMEDMVAPKVTSSKEDANVSL